MNAANPNTTGTVIPVPDFVYTQRRSGARIWASWVGYQISDSVAYANDLTGPKVYVGSDIGSIYCFNATGSGLPNATGATYSVFTAGGNVGSSPAVWDGKMYIGTTEGKLYCFDDSPAVDFNLYSAASKTGEMWNNETLLIAGRLISNPMMSEWDYNRGAYVPVASEYHPGLRNAAIQISLTKPDGTNVQLNATTDKNGNFNVSFNPTEVGDWGYVVYYEGQRMDGLTYNPVYNQFNTIAVSAAPIVTTPAPTSTPVETIAPTSTPEVTPEQTATPIVTPSPEPVDNTMTYAYIAIAVIVIVAVIAVAAFMLRKKKQ
jgi:hypothetical protein